MIRMIQSFIEDKERTTPEPLFDLSVLFHNLIFQLVDFDCGIHNEISKIGEKWWLDEKPGREALVTHTICYIALKAVDESKVADISRLYDLRKCFLLLDLEDENSNTIREALLRCAMHPRFLSSGKGKRFISFLFSLYVPFIEDIHRVIKAQVNLPSPF